MQKLTGWLIAGAVMLAACAPTGQTGRVSGGTPKVSGPDTCNASAFLSMIGQDAVVALSIPEPKRSYRPDEPVTLDHNPQRVNIILDDTDVITDIRCG